MKIFRKPYFAAFLSSLILFISCNQDSDDVLSNNDVKNIFDYSVYNSFINLNATDINHPSQNLKSVQSEQERLDQINRQFETNIQYPDDFLELIDKDPEFIETKLLSEGWLSEKDFFLIDAFTVDLFNSDFDTAIENYEKNVLRLNLLPHEFEIQNLAVNSLKAFNNNSPELFEGPPNWGCIRAGAALIVSSAALASCATVLACGLAVTVWIISYSAYVDNCID